MSWFVRSLRCSNAIRSINPSNHQSINPLPLTLLSHSSLHQSINPSINQSIHPRSFSTKAPRLTAKQAAAAQRSFSLRLYKAILRSHRRMLPPVMRDLGDSYVREEFKRHKEAKPEHLNAFFREWLGYLDQMKHQGESGFGAPLAEEHLKALTKEQQQQLEQLKKESSKAGEYAQQLAAEYSARMMNDANQSIADSDLPLPISAIDENNPPVEETSTDPFATNKRQ